MLKVRTRFLSCFEQSGDAVGALKNVFAALIGRGSREISAAWMGQKLEPANFHPAITQQISNSPLYGDRHG